MRAGRRTERGFSLLEAMVATALAAAAILAAFGTVAFANARREAGERAALEALTLQNVRTRLAAMTRYDPAAVADLRMAQWFLAPPSASPGSLLPAVEREGEMLTAGEVVTADGSASLTLVAAAAGTAGIRRNVSFAADVPPPCDPLLAGTVC